MMQPRNTNKRARAKKNRVITTESKTSGPFLYVFLDDSAVLPSWFVYPEIYKSVVPGGTEKLFKIPMEWKIHNNLTNYAFKIPSNGDRGKYVGKDDNYSFYLKHILVTDFCSPGGIFLILLDLHLVLLPKVKKQIEEAEKRGVYVNYLKVQQPAYNVLVHVWQ